MLTTLLPGIRELRAPIVAGYLWFLAAWIAFSDRIPEEDDASGLIRRIYGLAEAAGRPAVAAAVTLAAYLCGVLSATITTRLLRLVSNRLTPLPQTALTAEAPTPLGPQGKDSLRDAVVDRVLEQITNDAENRLPYSAVRHDLVLATGSGVPDHIRRQIVRERVNDNDLVRVASDLALLPIRLLGAEPDLYGIYDRLRAEAEFRAAASIPLTAVFTVLAISHSLFWFAGVPLAVLLFHRGTMELRSAGDVLAVALRARRAGVESPVLVEIVGRQLTGRGLLQEDTLVESAAFYVTPYVVRRLLDEGRAPDDPEKHEEAKRWLNWAVDVAGRHGNWDDSRPDDRATHTIYQLGVLFRELGELDDAERSLRMATNAGMVEARFELAGLLLERGDPEGAGEIFLTLRRDYATSDDVHSGLYEVGARLEFEGKLERADEFYREAVRNTFPRALFERAHARRDGGEAGGERALRVAADAGWEISRSDGEWAAKRTFEISSRDREVTSWARGETFGLVVTEVSVRSGGSQVTGVSVRESGLRSRK